MALEESILNSVKKTLGLDPSYKAFDHDVITHINTTFFTLTQLGIGPPEGFMIEDADSEWDEFTKGAINMNAVRTYMHLRVRSLFDPPSTPHHIAAMKEQISELEYRLKMEREVLSWPASRPLR